LLGDALHFTIYLSLKLKENSELLPCFESLMEDEYGLVDELVLLGFNIRKEVLCYIRFFPFNPKAI
jgi:hypothetical protein